MELICFPKRLVTAIKIVFSIFNEGIVVIKLSLLDIKFKQKTSYLLKRMDFEGELKENLLSIVLNDVNLHKR
jgi:hypothetical protein